MSKKPRLPDRVGDKKEKEDPELLRLNTTEKKLYSFDVKGNNAKAFISLKYIQTDHECFSSWSKDDLAGFSNLIKNLSNTSWTEIYKSAGKGENKSGLGYTPIDRDLLPISKVLDEVSLDLNFFELRVSQKARVHGFRSVNAFFLVWLDRNHSICG